MAILRAGAIAAVLGVGFVYSDAEARQALECEPNQPTTAETRMSPDDSAAISLGRMSAKICYNRPSLPGQPVGDSRDAPAEALRGMGVNELGIIDLSFPAAISGILVPPGSYSIYAMPSETEWTMIVNRSTSPSAESRYTADLRAQEIGRRVLPVLPALEPGEHTETFTIRFKQAGNMAVVMNLEWDDSIVYVPITVQHVMGIMPSS